MKSSRVAPVARRVAPIAPASLARLTAKPEPDPLATVKYTGNAEIDSAAELGALEQGFRERARREQERFSVAVDSEYWCAVCFQTRAQKEAFLQALGLLAHGDKYLDGAVVAKRLGIDLPPSDVIYPKVGKVDPKLVDLT